MYTLNANSYSCALEFLFKIIRG